MFHLCPGGLDTVAGCLARLTIGSAVLSYQSWYPVFNPLLHFVFEGIATPPGSSAYVLVVQSHPQFTREVNDRLERTWPSPDRDSFVIRRRYETFGWAGENVRGKPKNPWKREVKGGSHKVTPGEIRRIPTTALIRWKGVTKLRCRQRPSGPDLVVEY